MVFGELVIPSSRALWDEDYLEFPEYELENLEWENTGNISEDIEALYIVDTTAVIKLFEKCILKDVKPVKVSKKAGVKLYQLGKSVIMLYEHKAFTTGEIISIISETIDKSKNIYGITSVPIAMYQGDDSPLDLTCFIRSLSTKNVKNRFPKLQIPNLITGITANVLSYCIHTESICQLFVGFLDSAPLDSINTEPFLRLFKQIGLDIKENYNLVMQAPSTNLYM